MPKFFKHMKREFQRLIHNAKQGSVLDIVILSSGAVLGVTLIVATGVHLLTPRTGVPQAGTSSAGVMIQSHSDTTGDKGAVNPFGASSGGVSASSGGSGGNSGSGSSSRSGASSSRSSGSSSSSSALPVVSTPAVSTPATGGTGAGGGAGSGSGSGGSSSGSSAPPAVHTHSFGAWEPEAFPCKTTVQTRYCTISGCNESETRTVAVTAAHQWDNEQIITDAQTGEIVSTVRTCSVCGAQLTQLAEPSSTSAASSDAP